MLSNHKYFFVFLFALIIFTRFYKLNWGDDFFFNPDENNMISSVLQMSHKNLDPKFYAYGQFPLYLTFFTTPKHDFKAVALTLRFWSAIFSVLSLFILYFIGQKIFKTNKDSFSFLILLIFTPGLIQLSHFGTTESILLFVFSVNIFLSFKIYDNFKFKHLLLAGLISGIGLATKISALILTTPIFLSILFRFIKTKNKFLPFLLSILFIFITLIIGIIFSPYNLLNFPQFLSSIKYEIGVANGQIPVFYTRQFIGSLSYLFQLQKIFPYTNGLPIFIFGIFGLCIIFKSWIINHKSSPYLLLILFSSLIYFIYQGQLFVKWTRFMSPIIFVLPFLAVFILQKIKSRYLYYILILISILPGIYFMKIYFNTDIRVMASDWLNHNISIDNEILSESGNVVDIPVFGQLRVNNFDFYTLDNDVNNLEKLTQSINKSDYIIIPSRRVFKNQNNSNFLNSQNYYQKLFSGQFGFNLIKTFSNNNSLFLNSENAEETWSVFDNPTVRVFKRQ